MNKYVGYIYKTTNLVNKKIYIGLHRVNNDKIDPKYFGSGLHLKRAIEKYGLENFICEVLEWCATEEALSVQEKYWITHFNALDKEIGYNIQDGGVGGFGHIDSTGENNAMYGVHRYGEENPNYGTHWNLQSKQQMRDTIAQNGGHHGEKNPMFGKHHTDEAKNKMKQAKLDENGEYKYKGQNASLYGKHTDHPCFGLYWWCDGINPPVKSRTQPSPNHHRGRR